jgi:hypothetical protein
MPQQCHRGGWLDLAEVDAATDAIGHNSSSGAEQLS